MRKSIGFWIQDFEQAIESESEIWIIKKKKNKIFND
jgi:hypothetical protein